MKKLDYVLLAAFVFLVVGLIVATAGLLWIAVHLAAPTMALVRVTADAILYAGTPAAALMWIGVSLLAVERAFSRFAK